MGSGHVVVLPPFFDQPFCLPQATEPMLAQAIVPKLAVKALDVSVLRGFTWIDEVQFRFPLFCPA